MKGISSKIIITGIIILAFSAIIWAGIMDMQIERERFNKGICPECGGHWIFKNGEHIKNSGDIYYYECDNCHRIESFSAGAVR